MTAELGRLIGARSLDEIPERRHLALVRTLQLLLPDLAPDDVDQVIAERSGPACWLVVDNSAQPDVLAVLGDDGRYHLVVNHELVCCAGRVPAARRRVQLDDGRLQVTARRFRHELACRWWTDEATYRVHPPPTRGPVGGRLGQRPVSWLVRLTGDLSPPELVAGRRRCAATTTYPALAWWPPHLDPASTKGRIRARLVAELGERCHACGGGRGVFIDHEHNERRQVRGLLCRHCNSKIDGCLHLSGCAWAAYLDRPPAEHLGLRYPR